jgi:hypothetical protein
MGQALINPTAAIVWCYCCEAFQSHTVFPAEMDEHPTYFECDDCGCVFGDDEFQVVRPEDYDLKLEK